jgi:molybdopterin converting factor small subunit
LLQELANGQEIVEVEGGDVGECLWNLDKMFPGMAENIFDRNSKLRKDVEIFVNGKTAFPHELATIVADGDEISILVLLAGG